MCCWTEDVPSLKLLGIDWTEKDNEGLDAIECLAKLSSTPALATLLASITDEEFIAHATPQVWSTLCHDSQIYGDNSKSFKFFNECIHRLVTLFPNNEEKWAELLNPLMHINLRIELATVVYYLTTEYSGVEQDRIRRLAARALLTKFDAAYWQSFINYYNREYFFTPVPHLLAVDSRYQLTSEILDRVKRDITEAQFNEWIGQKDREGRTWLEYLEYRRPTLSSATRSKLQEIFIWNAKPITTL